MQVFAVVEDASCLGEQLVLMTCEDNKVYAYVDECLHLVAKDLKELLNEGLLDAGCPAYKKYYEGDAFNHMTEEDWAKEKQSPLGKKLDEEHRELVESLEPRILEILRSTRSKQELTADSTDERSCMLSSEGLRCKPGEQLKYSHSAGHQLDLSALTMSTGKTGQDFLASVLKYMSTNKGQIVLLKKPPGAKLRISDVDGTVYRHDEDKVYAWGNFFLPDPVHMQVFAVVEDASCLGEQLVLMTCEDKQVYAYDDECLHLVAKDLKELLNEGLLDAGCSAYKKYYEGDAFNHMTEEDWAKEKQSPLGKKLDEEHRELVESLEPRILKILRSTRSKQELTAESTDERSCLLSSEGLRSKTGEQLKYSHWAGRKLSVLAMSTGKTGQDFLASVLHYVWTNKGQIVPLKKPPGAKLRISDVDDTVHRHMFVYRYFFRPYRVHMQVFAVVEDVSYRDRYEQLVLMICEDKQVYAYDGVCLHLVAKDLEELLKEGLEYPGYEQYYDEEDFHRKTEEDWAKEMQSPLGKKLEHRKMGESLQPGIVQISQKSQIKTERELTAESTDSGCYTMSEGSSRPRPDKK